MKQSNILKTIDEFKEYFTSGKIIHVMIDTPEHLERMADEFGETPVWTDQEHSNGAFSTDFDNGMSLVATVFTSRKERELDRRKAARKVIQMMNL